MVPSPTGPSRSPGRPRSAAGGPGPWGRRGVGLVALVLPLGLLAWLLRSPLMALDSGLWGPGDPWANGDFNGNFWCWFRTSEALGSGVEWLERIGWPEGGDRLLQSFPNRVDAWLIAPFFRPDRFAALWNLQAVLHLFLTLLATGVATRLAGATPVAGATATVLMATSPVLLHELAGGRMATFVFWPGILCLGLVAVARRGGSPSASAPRSPLALLVAFAAGVLLGVQALAYPFYALAIAVMALVALGLHSSPPLTRLLHGLLLLTGALLVCGPFAWKLLAATSAFTVHPPPAGYTRLPVAGLLGLSAVPERFRLHLLFVPLALASLLSARARPWSLGGALGILLAMGPTISWQVGEPGLTSPVAWLQVLFRPLERMHHPVRIAPLALAAGGMGIALALDDLWRVRLKGARGAWAAVMLATWATVPLQAGAVQRVTSWAIPAFPPGTSAARWLGAHGRGPVVDVFGGEHIAGLALQPWHRRRLLESAEGYHAPPATRWSGAMRRRIEVVQALQAGEDPGLEGLRLLAEPGFRHLLLVRRASSDEQDTHRPGAARRLLLHHLGLPEYQDAEASVFSLDSLPPGTGGDPPP